MDKKSWDSLNKTERAELLKKAGLPTGLSQLSWAGLQKSERKKLEKHGKGWHEKATEVSTHEGVRKIAKRHHDVAVKKEAGTALNTPMERENVQDKRRSYKLKRVEGIYPDEFIKIYENIKPDKKPANEEQAQKESAKRGEEKIFPAGTVVRTREGKYTTAEPESAQLIDKERGIYELERGSGTLIYPSDQPSLTTDLIPYDPTFEKSEAERMMDERKQEEGTYEDIVVPYDTGDIGEMRQEAGIDETYRKLPEDWFSADRQKEWEKHEAEGYEGNQTNQTKPYDYYLKTYPLAMEWVNKHFKKVTNTKELEEAVQVYFSGDWKEFISFLQEKQDEIAGQKIEKEQKAEERKKELESRYFTTKFRDSDDSASRDQFKKECVEKTPVQKAHPFIHKGIALFAHKDGKEWKVTEATTGFELARAHQFKGKWRNNSKDEIIQTAKEFIDEKTPEKVSELIKYAADTISRTSPCL